VPWSRAKKKSAELRCVRESQGKEMWRSKMGNEKILGGSHDEAEAREKWKRERSQQPSVSYADIDENGKKEKNCVESASGMSRRWRRKNQNHQERRNEVRIKRIRK